MNRRLLRILYWIPAFVLCWFLWDNIVLWPVRLYAVFLHETGHALGAILTGGSVGKIRVFANEGGDCSTLGGIRLVVLSAGYLGNLLLGSLLLYIACKPWKKGLTCIVLGALTLLATALFVRNGYGLLFCGIMGAALIVCGRFAGAGINGLIAKGFGFVNILYPLWDIRSDILSRPGLRSDANMLAELVIGSWWPSALKAATLGVGICWITIGLVIAFWVLSSSAPLETDNGKTRN